MYDLPWGNSHEPRVPISKPMLNDWSNVESRTLLPPRKRIFKTIGYIFANIHERLVVVDELKDAYLSVDMASANLKGMLLFMCVSSRLKLSNSQWLRAPLPIRVWSWKLSKHLQLIN